MLVLGTSICSASDDQNKVTQDLLDKYQEMQYSVEAGITKVDYGRQYRELYIATQKAQGKIPQETYDKFLDAMKSYDNASTFWGKQYPVYYLSDVKGYVDDINRFKNEALRDVMGRFYKDSVVSYILGEANDKTRALTKELQSKLKESD